MHKIIGVCEACFKDSANAGQIEEVLNGIVSMLALVSVNKQVHKPDIGLRITVTI